MDNKQLYKRQNGNYEKIYPNALLSSILDRESGKSLKDIISAYNHLYVPFVNNIYETLTAIPVYIRRKGLWVTWETENDINTYQFDLSTAEAADNAIWGNIESWEKIPDLNYYEHHAAVPDGSITLDKLSDEVRQWLVNAGKIVNNPDNESITEEYGVIKLANRHYNTDTSSMGYIILNKNKTFTEQVTEENTIYEIKYGFTLNENFTIPNNCILKFEGGNISGNGIGNNTITGNNTLIVTSTAKIFENIILNGTFKNKFFEVEWFGPLVQGDSTSEIATQNLSTIQNTIDNAVRTSVLNVIIGGYNNLSDMYSKRIYINGTINVPSICSFGAIPRNKVGREDPNSILMIYQIANAPIIKIGGSNLSPDWCSHNSYKIAIHDIGLSTTVPTNKDSNVYGITNEGVEYGTSFCTFERVYISSCRFGIYIHYTKGSSTGAAWCLFNQIYTRYNIIGIYIKGDVNCNSWFNYNTFKECIFELNHNVGLSIWEFPQQFDGNIIDNCIFEQNGTNYDSEEYKTFGCSGIRCYTLRESVLYVKDCYFEQNYASKRTADATPGEGESWFNNSAYGETSQYGMAQNVEPTELSAQEGAIVAQFTTIDVSNCAIQGSHVFFQSWYDACFYIHDNSYGSNIINTKTKDCLVYYAPYIGTQVTWGQIRRLIINEYFIPQNIKRPYGFKNYDEAGTNIFGKFTVNISKNNVFEEEFIENGRLPENAILYIDTNSSIRNYKTSGTNPGTAIIEIAGSSQFGSSKVKSIKWVLVTNTKLPVSYSNILSYNDVIFESLGLDNTITAKVWNSVKTKYAGKLIFNNLTIDQDNRSNILIRGNTYVEFNNCIIKVTKDSFINFISGVSEIVLNNCTFINETESTYFFIENYGNSAKLTTKNCIIPANVVVTVNPIKGTTAERNAIPSYRLTEAQEYYDMDLHKPLYYNGTAWVDATGTQV